ncbi:PAS domain S-box protein [Desulfosporosinus sp. Sb-LF]|uniref:SpoIIE family protein phosphatase n=1 Tax=Desulfosporosinus sp. Sb-LF TaxID=2560027 RepID=UPI00107F8039|nr:PAS domain S-box protein [Desulfosporosinus sp. Sb-LF]TGE33694.1 PAS domain S-box protein [Desulfosporosinus sp. Sb-LF]
MIHEKPEHAGTGVVEKPKVASDIVEWERLELELANQKRFLKKMLDTIPDLIVYKDINSEFLGCNKGYAEKVLGMNEDEVCEKKVLDFTEDRERAKLCRQKDQEIFVTGKSLKYEEKFHLINGSVMDTETVKTPIVDEKGKVTGLIAISRDITERKRLEKQLWGQMKYAELLFRTVPSAVLSVDKNRKIIRWNKIAEEITGYTESEVVGKECSMILHGVGIEGCELCRNASDSPLINQMCKIVTKEGQSGHVLKSIAVLKDEFGEISERMECFEDITGMIEMEAELRASEEKFRQLAETINEIFLITDKERIVYVSPAYERISGMTCQSLIDDQSSLVELIHPADRERIRASLFQGFESMNEVTNVEFRIIRHDGEMRWLWLRSFPILAEDNNSPLKATSIVDITDRKRVEDKLRERERQTQMELLLAARVQQDSLPHPISGDKVRVSSIFVPHSTVSGDFFNYKWFEEQKMLCGYIIDVCGHGVATAMQTATFKMMLDNVLLTGEEIKEGDIQTINQRIMQYLYEDSFVALLYFEFDLLAGVLKLICAGITLFLAAKPDECTLVPLSGCYLGIVNVPEIETYIIPVKAGEIYCMMSDGVSDLIELNGISKQEGLTGYMRWFEELAKCPERNDDFSAVCIEILQDRKETDVLDIKDEEELQRAQVIISEFLERNVPMHAPMLEVAVNEAMNNGFGTCGRVRVKTRRMGSRLIIRVKDDGPGFNAGEVTAKRVAGNYESEFDGLLEAEGGRGIFLMRSFCDKVIYNAKGNEVLLMKII